jgi:hypothetical protein
MRLPTLLDKAHLKLIDAYHPLLLLYNKKLHKPVIPDSISLDDKSRILVNQRAQCRRKDRYFKNYRAIANDDTKWIACFVQCR